MRGSNASSFNLENVWWTMGSYCTHLPYRWPTSWQRPLGRGLIYKLLVVACPALSDITTGARPRKPSWRRAMAKLGNALYWLGCVAAVPFLAFAMYAAAA